MDRGHNNMSKQNQRKNIFFVGLLLFSVSSNAQKNMLATYEGGHGCVYRTLTIFSDSTFYYKDCTALFIPNCRKKKGAYLFGDSSITLYTKKKLHAFIAKPENKYTETTFRLRENSILLYNEDEEKSANSEFIKTYNTLKKL